jgi:hypothetical protein
MNEIIFHLLNINEILKIFKNKSECIIKFVIIININYNNDYCFDKFNIKFVNMIIFKLLFY